MLSLCKSENNTTFEKLPVIGKRPLFFAAVFLLAGILFAHFIKVRAMSAVICALLCIIVYISFKKYKHSAVMVLCAIMFFSMAYYSAYSQPPINNLESLGKVEIYGRVAEIKNGEKTDTYLLSDVEVNGTKIGKNIFLTCNKSGYKLDDFIAASGELKEPAKASYQLGFDYNAYCLSKNAAYTCLSYDTGYAGHAKDVLAFINGVRYEIAEKMDELFGTDSAIAKAFIIGMDEDIEEQLLTGYRNTGISHVLCVSGLHVGFIYMAVVWLLKIWKAGRKTRFYCGAASVIIFAALAGFSTSVIRAGLMCVLFSLGNFLGKRTDGLTSLSAAFVICVLFNPCAVFGASFQLSFAAVFGILLITPTVNRHLKFIKSAYIRSALGASLGATIGTCPLILNINHSFYFPSILVNLFVVPFCSILIPAVLVVTLTYCIFGGITAYLAIPIRFMITALNGVSSVSLLSDFGNIGSAAISGTCLISFFGIIFVASKYIAAKKSFKIAVCAIFLVVMMAGYIVPIANTADSLVIVDAGNADFSVLRSKDEVLLIDTGKDDDRAIDYLESYAIYPDYILITNADERKVGGLSKIYERYPDVTVLMEPEVRAGLSLNGIKAEEITGNFKVGNAEVKPEHFDGGTRLTINYGARDVCVFLEDGAVDIPKAEIIKLYARGKRQKYEGRDMYLSGAGYALISSASALSEDTAEKLEGMTVVNTYENGNITVKFGEKTEVRSIHEG